MVLVSRDEQRQVLFLDATMVVYGHASSEEIGERIAGEIEALWNEPGAETVIHRVPFRVIFRIRSAWRPGISQEEILGNTDPRLNFFRVEEFAFGNISFVDGLGSNTGYFKMENLYPGSTTAAHEFGHGLGLDHPRELDIRGHGKPGIMYPRGTWVDPPYQYDPQARPGEAGGTMHPMHRRVRAEDVRALRLERLRFLEGKAVLGGFTNIYHPDHGE